MHEMRILARRLHSAEGMPAIQRFLQRLGFVKLDRFGLELTAEGRILSRRPAVLDDGAGGRVVGWQDGDFAVAELARWQPGVQGLTQPRVPPPAPRTRPSAIPPVISASSSVSPGVMPVPVAAEPGVDEDDWEWTIALARARASGETTQPVPRQPRAQTSRTRPIAVVAVKDPAWSSEWPATAPLGAIDYDSRPVVAIPPPTPPRVAHAGTTPAPVPLRAGTALEARAIPHVPSTIIPVPSLPTVQGTAQSLRMEPVVRPGQRRFAQGTAHPATSQGMAAMTDDTIPNLAIGDRTRPGIAMPAAARAVELPSTRRASRR